jgi:tape measure domain-containing protein
MIDIEAIGVGVDTSGVRTGTRDLDTFGKSADSASRKADGLGTSGTKAAKDTQSLGKAANDASVHLQTLYRSLLTVGTAAAAIRISDEYTKLTAQLKLATRSADEFAAAFANVKRISDVAQSSLGETATLYARLSNATRELGANQTTVASITETVALALKVSGATAAEASSAMLQLSQAFGSGVLRGEEFNAINEASPRLMKALADGMGVPIGALRNMASEGQITSDVLGNALVKSLDDLRKEAEQMRTISGAFTQLKNEVLLAAGAMDTASGAGKGLAKIITDFAKSGFIRTVFETIAVLGVEIQYVFKQVGNEIGGIAAQLAAIMTLDFSRAGEIHRMMVEDAKQARIEQDALIESIMNPKVENAPIVEEIKQLKIATTEANDEGKKLKKTLEDIAFADSVRIAKMLEEEGEAIRKHKEAIEQQRQKQTDAIDGMLREVAGWNELTEVQRTQWEIQTGKYKDFDAQSQDVLLRLAAELDLREQINDNMKRAQEQANINFNEAQRKEKEHLKKLEAEAERTFDNVSRALTDALMRGFENGKEFAQNFRDTLVNMFKTLVLQPIINFIVNPIAGAITAAVGSVIPGVAQASTGSLTGGLSLIDTIAKGNAGIISGIESLGAIIANGNGGVLDAIGGFMGQYAGQIANILPFASAGLALLQGDVKGALFQGGGAAIGTILGGPVGGLIGSFLGGALGGLFGEKVGQPDSFTSAVIDMATGKASINRLADNDGGNAKSSIDFTLQVAENFAKMVEALGGALHESGGFAPNFITRTRAGMMTFEMKDDEMTNPDTQFGSVSRIGRILVDPNDSEAVQERIADTYIRALKKFADLPEYLTRALDSYTENLNDKMGDETSASNFLDFLLGLQTLRTSLEGMPELFQRLIPMVEQVTDKTKLDAMNGTVMATEQFYALFYSDAEKFADATSQLQRAFDGLGVAMPDTRSAFRELVESFDLTTEAGFGMYYALVSLAPAMDAYYKELEKQREAIDALLLSTDRFRTKVDYTRALRYSENGISLDMLPQFASGGDFGGGVRMVGENGPEIELTGPSRIISTQEIMSRLRDPQANSQALIAEIKSLRNELRAANIAAVKASQKTAKLLDQFDKDGMPPTRA